MEKLLVGAGELLDTCHDRSWGCTGLDGRCPLDGHDIDVAVAVAEPGVAFDAQGVACVHRARIPLVTIGARPNDPVGEFATVNVARADETALPAIRTAAADASGHQRAVEHDLAAHLEAAEHVAVTVQRRPNAVHVVLVGHLTPTRAAALTDVARAAIRAHDRRIAVIDVSTKNA